MHTAKLYWLDNYFHRVRCSFYSYFSFYTSYRLLIITVSLFRQGLVAVRTNLKNYYNIVTDALKKICIKQPRAKKETNKQKKLWWCFARKNNMENGANRNDKLFTLFKLEKQFLTLSVCCDCFCWWKLSRWRQWFEIEPTLCNWEWKWTFEWQQMGWQ